jgi:hypothetical protein
MMLAIPSFLLDQQKQNTVSHHGVVVPKSLQKSVAIMSTTTTEPNHYRQKCTSFRRHRLRRFARPRPVGLAGQRRPTSNQHS